jgi:1A family penicillin-binding protein
MSKKIGINKSIIARKLNRYVLVTKNFFTQLYTKKIIPLFKKRYSSLKPLYLAFKHKQHSRVLKLAKKHAIPLQSFTPIAKYKRLQVVLVYILKRPFFIIPFLLLSIGGFLFHQNFLKDLPNPKNIGRVNFEQSTQIFDRNGVALYQIFGSENRVPIRLKDLPAYVPNAFIAIEDKDFRKHMGVSLSSGILRALKENIFGGSNSLQGGSTITQQLVKRSLLTSNKTYKRKIQEMILAVWAERIFSKNTILELYLNEVAFGGSSYGIEQASKSYFNKSAKELTMAEAALLAGLPQAPSTYSPFNNLDAALKRRSEVLRAMLEQKYIAKADYDLALYNKPQLKEDITHIKAPHFVFYVKEQLEKKYGVEAVEQGGLKVQTTLDINLQDKVQNVVKEEITKLKNPSVSNGAALVTRPGTGEILAMIGSIDYFATGSGSFNVTTAMRQPGSSFKPINYAVGIDRGIITAATPLQDSPVCFEQVAAKPYCPLNYDRGWHGLVSIRSALANSYNIPAVKVNALNGVKNLVASSEGFLISSLTDPSRYGLSLTLGGGEVPMTEMAQAYSAFANGGTPKKLTFALKITDKDGRVLEDITGNENVIQNIDSIVTYPSIPAQSSNKAISSQTAYIISHILADNAARSPAFGSNSELYIKGKTVSVKTGTTNEYRDNWTIGYTPNFLTAIWVGNNDFRPMYGVVSGITGAAPIWKRVMSDLLKNKPDLPLIKPDGVDMTRVCKYNGQPTNSDNCPSYNELIIKGKNGYANQIYNKKVLINKDNGQPAKEGDTNVEEQDKTFVKDAFSEQCNGCTSGTQLIRGYSGF